MTSDTYQVTTNNTHRPNDNDDKPQGSPHREGERAPNSKDKGKAKAGKPSQRSMAMPQQPKQEGKKTNAEKRREQEDAEEYFMDEDDDLTLAMNPEANPHCTKDAPGPERGPLGHGE